MKTLFIQRYIVIIIVALIIGTSVVGAISIDKKIIKKIYGNKFLSIDSKLDENIEIYFDISGNQPPETPDISGPTMGKPGVELSYNIVSTDPEENDIVYCFDWGDDSGQICIGPFKSGEEVIISHTWSENGTYTITVKASDIFGQESGLATLKVKITTYRTKEITKNIIFSIISRIEIFSKNITILFGMKTLFFK